MRTIIAAVSLLAFGCSQDVESTDVRTSGVYPEIMVTATGNGSSTVRVQLKVGGSSSNTFLDLKGDDRLEASIGDEAPKTLDGSGNGYTATFPTDAEGTEFTIAFMRGADDDSAPASKVTMPAPFDLMLSTTSAGRGADDIDVTWDPPATGNADWKLSGECIKLDSGAVPDDGTHTIEAGTIETFESDKDKSCTATFEMIRKRSGTVDPAFTEGGSVVARHVRSESFTSTP